ncbi:protein-associating with the carboxyl-terminal domain of ezrin-like [Branchiostoma lanceolatum]|uniref:protein-associating with the carboxyl-terminal domain of ezrin-like n=1 Tax=Branchiostoma lanceolatum TaxID=7740 RepID=UPI0034564595
MGSESSTLQGCDFEEEVETSEKNWTLHSARKKDGSKVSVFVHKSTQPKEDPVIQNAAKQLKILRHPTILRFFDTCQNVEGTYLITESVRPLELVIDALTSAEICAGLFNVIEALSFLHERGGVCHNNVCMSSIYVSGDGSWRLGGFEHLCKFEQATPEYLSKGRHLRNAQYLPPEEKEDQYVLNVQYGHARDAYAFGILAEQMLEYLSEMGGMCKTFELSVSEGLLHPDPNARPKLKTLLSDKIFKNDYLEIMNFLKNITVKDEEEKNFFFSTLAAKVYSLPPALVATRLVPQLMTRLVMAEPVAVESFYPHLLTPSTEKTRSEEFIPGQVNPVLPAAVYREHVIPILADLFAVHEEHVRMILLHHFSAFVEQFDPELIRRRILRQLLLGLKDTNDQIVAATLRALAEVVPVLGGEVVVGGHRKKYFKEGRPKFATFMSSPEVSRSNAYVSNLTAVSGVINLPFDIKTSPPKAAKPSVSVKPSKEADNGSAKRQLERERKREEMKRRSEERRKERERKRLEREQERLLSKAMEEEERREDSVNEISDTRASTNQIIAAMETRLNDTTEEADDWSDWEDTSVGVVQAKEEDAISQEIEQELEKMDSLPHPDEHHESKEDNNLFLDIVPAKDTKTLGGKDVGTPSESEWGGWGEDDRPEDDRSVGSASVQSESPKSMPKDTRQTATHSTSGKHSTTKHSGMKLKGRVSKSQTEDTKSTTYTDTLDKTTNKRQELTRKVERKLRTNLQQIEEKDLGKDFEIEAKVIKKEEDDFFTDMVPEFKPASVTLLSEVEEVSLTETTSTVQSTEHEHRELSAVFAAQDTEVEAGWGDEEDISLEDTDLTIPDD